jgi:hypothetical protein
MKVLSSCQPHDLQLILLYKMFLPFSRATDLSSRGGGEEEVSATHRPEKLCWRDRKVLVASAIPDIDSGQTLDLEVEGCRLVLTTQPRKNHEEAKTHTERGL